MNKQSEMATLSRVLAKLSEKGFDNELVMNENGEMISETLGKKYGPEDLLVFKNFRFEGESNPDDNSIILMVEDKDGDIGYILDSYGFYSSHDGPEFDDFIKKIPTDEREFEELFEDD